MLFVLYQLAVKGETEVSVGKIQIFKIITILYEDLVSRLTWLFSHAMMQVLFFLFCTLQGVIYYETKQFIFSYY